jgi:hypothetical protein
MKKDMITFIKKSIIFFALLLLLINVMNIVYVKEVLEKKWLYRKEIIFQEYISSLSNKRINFAFFGDSHTSDDVNPKFIPGAFNFAPGGENYIKTYYKVKRILYDDKVKINNLVLEVDLHTFSTLLTEKPYLFNDLYLYSKFVPYNEIKKIRDDSIITLWTEANFPFVGNGEEFSILLSGSELTEIYLGWTKNEKNFSLVNRTDVAYKKYKEHFEGKSRISDLSFEYFMRILRLARKNNINVIFIKYPVSKEYDEVITQHNITKNDYYNRIFNSTESILGQSLVLDYYDIFFNSSDYFADSDHLNYVGAEIFSKRVYQDLKRNNLTI